MCKNKRSSRSQRRVMRRQARAAKRLERLQKISTFFSNLLNVAMEQQQAWQKTLGEQQKVWQKTLGEQQKVWQKVLDEQQKAFEQKHPWAVQFLQRPQLSREEVREQYQIEEQISREQQQRREQERQQRLQQERQLKVQQWQQQHHPTRPPTTEHLPAPSAPVLKIHEVNNTLVEDLPSYEESFFHASVPTTSYHQQNPPINPYFLG